MPGKVIPGKGMPGQGKSCDKPGSGEGNSCENSKGEPAAGDGQSGDKRDSKGGPGRGGDTAPLTLREHPPQLTSSREESLTDGVGKNDDAPGELLGLSSQKPDAIDPSRMAAGGDTLADGKGSAASWRQTLTPEEQAVLEKFFK